MIHLWICFVRFQLTKNILKGKLIKLNWVQLRPQHDQISSLISVNSFTHIISLLTDSSVGDPHCSPSCICSQINGFHLQRSIVCPLTIQWNVMLLTSSEKKKLLPPPWGSSWKNGQTFPVTFKLNLSHCCKMSSFLSRDPPGKRPTSSGQAGRLLPDHTQLIVPVVLSCSHGGEDQYGHESHVPVTFWMVLLLSEHFDLISTGMLLLPPTAAAVQSKPEGPRCSLWALSSSIFCVLSCWGIHVWIHRSI